jgi:hemolysin D
MPRDRSGIGTRRTGGKGDPENSSNDDERQSHQPAYVAHVALSETGINTEQGFTPLEPGMAVTAEIKTGQRRVISYLLSPLLRYKQEGLRER